MSDQVETSTTHSRRPYVELWCSRNECQRYLLNFVLSSLPAGSPNSGKLRDWHETPAMTPALHKLNLTAHVTSSVGWLGAVAAFLVLSIAGLTSQDPEIVRGSYLAMNLI